MQPLPQGRARSYYYETRFLKAKSNNEHQLFLKKNKLDVLLKNKLAKLKESQFAERATGGDPGGTGTGTRQGEAVGFYV